MLTEPGVVGVHIGEQRLEPDSKLADDVQSKRSQQCQVACHLFNVELLGTHMENALRITEPGPQTGRVNGIGNVDFMESGEGQNNE